MTPHRRCTLGVLILLGLARPAAAVGLEEWELAVDARGAWVQADDRRPVGPGLGLQLQYGLTDAWALRGAVGLSGHPVGGNADRGGGTVTATSAIAGVTYTVDVLRLVPFVEAGVGLLDVRGAVAGARSGLGIDLGVGAQYLVSRRWAVGVVGRYQVFPVELGSLSSDDGETPSLVALALRLARIF